MFNSMWLTKMFTYCLSLHLILNMKNKRVWLFERLFVIYLLMRLLLIDLIAVTVQFKVDGSRVNRTKNLGLKSGSIRRDLSDTWILADFCIEWTVFKRHTGIEHKSCIIDQSITDCCRLGSSGRAISRFHHAPSRPFTNAANQARLCCIIKQVHAPLISTSIQRSIRV